MIMLVPRVTTKRYHTRPGDLYGWLIAVHVWIPKVSKFTCDTLYDESV